MKILFVMRHEGYIRNCEHLITFLNRRGHEIEIRIAGASGRPYDVRMMEEFSQKNPGARCLPLPAPRIGWWDDCLSLDRILIDFLRYLDPIYENAPKLKARVERNTPVFFRTVFRIFPFLRRPGCLRFLDRFFRGVEASAPANRGCLDFLSGVKPDVVLFCPLLDYESYSIDYLKAARKLGFRTGLVVASWDNLTNKGLVQIEPDRILVWNQAQKREALEMHGLSPEKIRVTGAHLFDHWFEMKPSGAREHFLSGAGLDSSRPFLLYVGSSGFIAEDKEVAFVKEWLEKIRNSGNDALRKIGVMVRPHPGNSRPWEGVDLSAFGNTVVWLPENAAPHYDQAKKDYYDCLYHSLAVVGINTSAMVEAAILGKPVYTILDPVFRDTQSGTLHFHHLSRGGLLSIGENLETHVAELARLVDTKTNGLRRQTDFVKEFLRPQGVDVPSAPLAAAAIEELASLGILSIRERRRFLLAKTLLFPLAAACRLRGAVLRLGNSRKSRYTLAMLLKNRAKKKSAMKAPPA